MFACGPSGRCKARPLSHRRRRPPHAQLAVRLAPRSGRAGVAPPRVEAQLRGQVGEALAADGAAERRLGAAAKEAGGAARQTDAKPSLSHMCSAGPCGALPFGSLWQALWYCACWRRHMQARLRCSSGTLRTRGRAITDFGKRPPNAKVGAQRST